MYVAACTGDVQGVYVCLHDVGLLTKCIIPFFKDDPPAYESLYVVLVPSGFLSSLLLLELSETQSRF